MLYHVSKTGGLRTLTPHVSTHKKAYVYAIENMVTGMLFGAKHDDFDFLISTDEKGFPTVYECYPDAFEKVYQGKSCFVYTVDETGFLRGMTSWDSELVCESEVEIVSETVIEDMYQQLLSEEEKGNLIIRRYEFEEAYRKLIASHVVDRIIRFGIDLDKICKQDIRFELYYKDIVQELSKVMDGHLLR